MKKKCALCICLMFYNYNEQCILYIVYQPRQWVFDNDIRQSILNINIIGIQCEMQQKCHILIFIQNRCSPSMSSLYINLGSRSKTISFAIGPIKPETTLHTHQFRLRFCNYYPENKTDFHHWFKLSNYYALETVYGTFL